MENNKRKIYVIGHKNPDTDSICSAIAYADIKNRTEENPVYEAKRAGQINEETLYVLKRFQMNTPGYMPNVGTRVKDMDVRKVGGVDSKISLKKAWTLMRNENVFTLPILNQNQELEGLITTNDITESYMDVYNNAALSEARTPYRNILETVDGTMIVGNEHAHFTDGKVLIAASSPEVMEQSVEQNDLVILGNRYEAQLCAIEMGASCIIVCMGVPISKTIRRLAEERECFVISSPHDTYTVARLINQSMPVKHFMTSENLVKFSIDDYTDDIKEVIDYIRNTKKDMKIRINTNGLANDIYGRDVTPEYKGRFDTVSISLNAPTKEEFLELTRSKFGISSFDDMLDFAKKCKAYVPNVVLTVVDIIGEEKIEACQKITDEIGVTLRVRPFEE